MKIDTRIPMAIAAFFAPAIFIRIMIFFWGVEVEPSGATLAMNLSVLFGFLAMSIVPIFLNDKKAKYIKLWGRKNDQ